MSGAGDGDGKLASPSAGDGGLHSTYHSGGYRDFGSPRASYSSSLGAASLAITRTPVSASADSPLHDDFDFFGVEEELDAAGKTPDPPYSVALLGPRRVTLSDKIVILAECFALAGHSVVVASHDLEKATHAVGEVLGRAKSEIGGMGFPADGLRAETWRAAARECDVLLLCMEYSEAVHALAELEADIVGRGKIVVDVTTGDDGVGSPATRMSTLKRLRARVRDDETQWVSAYKKCRVDELADKAHSPVYIEGDRGARAIIAKLVKSHGLMPNQLPSEHDVSPGQSRRSPSRSTQGYSTGRS